MHDVITVTTTGGGGGGQRSRTMMLLTLLLPLIAVLAAAPIAADAEIDPPAVRRPLIGSAGSAAAAREATEPLLRSWESRSLRRHRNADAPRDLCSMPGCRCSGIKLEVVQCNFTGSVSGLCALAFWLE